ncbi:ComF family protein [Mycolicibacterium psychrotolerans]|uniref:ComF family protein n=1 Tax=Mycolicibacterium psychrotolerans TaxID=216929 RepID=UPI003D674B6D
MLDLILPLECGGCGAPSTKWCDVCAATLNVHTDEPHLVTPRIDPGVPVFALGRYVGPRRQAIIALKEHGRRDLVAPFARALALGIHQLETWGILDTPFTIVPAPTRALAARRRGGDPVLRIATQATRENRDITVIRALKTRAMVRDSVGLTIADRERNLAGRIKLIKHVTGEVLLVDDIVTTGATAREAVRTLREFGVNVTAVLALAHA